MGRERGQETEVGEVGMPEAEGKMEGRVGGERREDGTELEDPKASWRDMEREWATDGGMSIKWER